jgi:hypothetical protein
MSRNVFFLFFTRSLNLSKRVQSFFQSRKCFLKVFKLSFAFLSFAARMLRTYSLLRVQKYHLYTLLQAFDLFFVLAVQPLTLETLLTAQIFSDPPSSYREERQLYGCSLWSFYINATFYNRFSLFIATN